MSPHGIAGTGLAGPAATDHPATRPHPQTPAGGPELAPTTGRATELRSCRRRGGGTALLVGAGGLLIQMTSDASVAVGRSIDQGPRQLRVL